MKAKAIVRGALTKAYQDGYKRRMSGGENAVLNPPLDPQGKWLYMNGAEDAAIDERGEDEGTN